MGNNLEEIEKMFFESYYNEGSIPCPTIVEALSKIDYDSRPEFRKAQKMLIDNFSKYYTESLKIDNRKKHSLPNEAISFIVPLDFYIPIYEPYNACSVYFSDESDYAVCGSIFSLKTPIFESTLRTSFIICTICGFNEATSIESMFADNRESVMSEITDCCNRIISSYEAVPIRHTHYFHQITNNTLPSMMQYFVFSRTKRKVLDDGYFFAHTSVLADCYSSEHLPDSSELTVFRDIHINYDTIYRDVVRLIAKAYDAVYCVCHNKNEEAILLIDHFADSAIGFLYCEIRRVKFGEDVGSIMKRYSDKADKSGWHDELAETFGFDKKDDYLSAVEYWNYKKRCRDVRNNLMHRFFTAPISDNEAEQAVVSACNMVTKAINVAQQFFDENVDNCKLSTLLLAIEFPLRHKNSEEC